jgi:hypothetical protein
MTILSERLLLTGPFLFHEGMAQSLLDQFSGLN